MNSNSLIVGTYNVKNPYKVIKYCGEERIQDFAKYITGENGLKKPIDILGVQEFRKGFLNCLKELIGNYDIIGNFRGWWLERINETNSIFVSKTNNELLESETIFLGPRWQRIVKMSYTSFLPRIATCTIVDTPVFSHPVIVINTHIHYKGKFTRRRQLERLRKYIEKMNKEYERYPIILTGDFNLQPGEEIFEKFIEKISNTLSLIKIDGHTHHKGEKTKRLDYIFASLNTINIEKALIDKTKPDLSDHYPILIEITER